MKPDWIALDWGTQSLRACAMSASGSVLAEATADQGTDGLTPDQFEPTLLGVLSDWLDGPTPVVACGMLAGPAGWVDAQYATVPCQIPSTGYMQAPTRDPRLQVTILSGIKQSTPTDFMQGEETKIAGFLARNPNWDGVICLPGMHTKWVHISADEIISFQTFMTGELCSAISGHTVLRHSLHPDVWNADAFQAGLADGIERPERLAARLFSLQAENILQIQNSTTGYARLLGLLIGAELAASKPYWLGQQIAVIGDAQIAKCYIDGLATQSAPATQVKANAMIIAGLTAAYHRING